MTQGLPGNRAPASGERLLSIVSARFLVVAAILTILALGGSPINGYWMVSIAVVALSLDLQSPFTLRNWVVLYTVGLFYIGARLILPGHDEMMGDLLLYLVTFQVGYIAIKSRWRLRPVKASPDRAHHGGPEVIQITETVLRWLGAIEVVRLLVLIKPYGLRGFYSGQELVARISSFGQTGTSPQAIVNISLTSLIAAVAAFYCAACIQHGRAPKNRLLIVVLILLPTVSLQRSVLVQHSLLLAGIYVCDKRFRVSQQAVVKEVRPAKRRRWLPALVLIAAVLMAGKIGDIRTKRIDQTISTQHSDESSLQQVLRGEFTPIVFYHDAKHHMGTLRYRYGEPIVGALITRAVPRGLWPNKPLTTQEVYMRELRPVELARGFSLASSLFGALYINFGLLGTAICMTLVGSATAYYDETLAGRILRRVPAFLIVLTWSYSFFRDDVATSLFSILLTLGLYRAYRSMVTKSEIRPTGSEIEEVSGLGA